VATLREFVLSQSSLPTGNIVRDHILNPAEGGGGTGVSGGGYDYTQHFKREQKKPKMSLRQIMLNDEHKKKQIRIVLK